MTEVPDPCFEDRRFTRSVLYASEDAFLASSESAALLLAVVFFFFVPLSSFFFFVVALVSSKSAMTFSLVLNTTSLSNCSIFSSTSTKPPTAQPRSNLIPFLPPFLSLVTSTYSLSALTTLIPTPCSPPDTLYPEEEPALSNFPPAWSTVSTVSRAEVPVVGCKSYGMPRPLSTMVMQLPPSSLCGSSCKVTVIREAWPASASSTELSSTSQMR